MAVTNYFTDHPAAAGETYREHFRVAMGISRELIGAGFAAAVHALLPNFHETTASDRIHRLHHCLESGNRQAIGAHQLPPCPEELRRAS